MKKFILSILIALSCLNASGQWDKDVFYMRGRMALQDGKYAQAIESFNILARLDTTDYWNFFFRGIAKYNLGDIRGAKKDFERSVRINPVFTNGYHYRAITESQGGEFEAALADLQKAIELRPGNIGIYFSRGVTYFLSQQFDKAIEDFNTYIRQEPKDPSAMLNRGACYLFLGDTLKSLSDYNSAIKLDRFEPEGYIRRGRLYAGQKRYEEAISDMNFAITLDSTNTFAYFNRAIMHYECKNYNAAMWDLNKVLREEPGNALTLYNRSLINAQVGNMEAALEDMDRVININPGNVLALYNRASFFVEMGRWKDALQDYDKAIELYPDFAKAYLNRSYVEMELGMTSESKKDYKTAQQKIREYQSKTANEGASFADTTKKYSSLLSLDAEFAKKDFDDELLQHRDIDIRLKQLYKFKIREQREDTNIALSNRYENVLLDNFIAESPVAIGISNRDTTLYVNVDRLLGEMSSDNRNSESSYYFLKGLDEIQKRQFSTALSYFDMAVKTAEDPISKNKYSKFYKAFYLMNRGVLKAEMIEFIASIENNVQKLTMDDQGNTNARVSDRVNHNYDYSEAIMDMTAARDILPEMPYIYFNLGNLYSLSSQPVEAIKNYNKAINLYPNMGDGYYNRGLVLIFLKDKEKGCIDLSKAGELGISDAYSVINKYCKEEEE